MFRTACRRFPALALASRRPATKLLFTSTACFSAATAATISLMDQSQPGIEAARLEKRHQLYPPVEANVTGMLKVSDVHTLYWEESGNPQGKPVIVVHGGPGGGSTPSYRRFFDPNVYRIINFDQRGAGKSTPHACLEDNTTWTLVEDIERLRKHLDVDKWQVFGGSWGSTLSLTYAICHPDKVTELVLRGIFMLRRHELEWYYQEGGSYIFPDKWENYRDCIPPNEREDMMAAYHKRLTGEDKAEQMRAAKAWTTWEMGTSTLFSDPKKEAQGEDPKFALAFARIENHFFVNKGFFPTDAWILENAYKLRDIPAVIVQGRYDVVCPMKSAWDLHRAWPSAKLVVMEDSGHSCMEPGTLSELVKATDVFGSR